ncbi:heme biosynthesis HemY N-terminal domain-containing protein [Pseudoxanthomonas dokdonensis]|uniref:Porphyrin biosynthesis protein n=1 Tax=Pseudoxanthomonas dokdonensis TaxID=344882 RepID=A0A0R0D0J5_9GAMM|nr:heme biosynthesis HemY N-terminal domain-containing protein [Pseudoxanthomonas dokdonensis]KRG71982.1 porphyrin biosynthesis protein [Pseudoxanthomonas dokdonensis]
MKLFRSVIILLLLLLVGVVVSQWLMQDGTRDLGEVFITMGGYEITTNVPRAIIALALAVGVLWLVWSLLSMPFRVWARYRRKQYRARLLEGLEAVHRGHWQRAEKLLDRAAADKEVGTIARVAAVRAADARLDAAAAERHLSALAQTNATAYALTVADRALAQQRPADALAALDAPAAQPLPPRGLALRAKALAASARGSDAYGLLGPLKQQNALPKPTLDKLEAQWAAQALREAADANALAERWEQMPKLLRTHPQVVSAYAERAASMRWDDAATHSLEHALDSQWDESLAGLYGRLPLEKMDSRRASAQRWLQAHPASPALLVTLARLARGQGQLAQAQEFLHRALAQGADAEAWEEMGHGFAAAGEADLAQLSYANALRVARGEAARELPGRDLRQKIFDQAVTEERDEHGMPRLRS